MGDEASDVHFLFMDPPDHVPVGSLAAGKCTGMQLTFGTRRLAAVKPDAVGALEGFGFNRCRRQALGEPA
jgi:hypothetical protein